MVTRVHCSTSHTSTARPLFPSSVHPSQRTTFYLRVLMCDVQRQVGRGLPVSREALIDDFFISQCAPPLVRPLWPGCWHHPAAAAGRRSSPHASVRTPAPGPPRATHTKRPQPTHQAAAVVQPQPGRETPRGAPILPRLARSVAQQTTCSAARVSEACRTLHTLCARSAGRSAASLVVFRADRVCAAGPGLGTFCT